MATYLENEENVSTQDFVMYGSSRLGIKNADPLLATAVNTKQYELSNHLGNVLAGHNRKNINLVS